jgi:limonene-1,2-epoxide hydrolase
MAGPVVWEHWVRRAEAALDLTAGATVQDWRALFAPGGTYEDPVNPTTADVDSIHEMTKATLPDWRSTVTSVTAGADGCAFEWIGEATAGRSPVSVQGCTVVEVNSDGLVTRWRDYFDMKGLETQFGE